MLATSDSVLVTPVRQFHRVGGRVEVWPLLRTMLKILRDQDPWSVASLVFGTRVNELGGRTILELAAEGDTHTLSAFAHQIRSEWT